MVKRKSDYQARKKVEENIHPRSDFLENSLGYAFWIIIFEVENEIPNRIQSLPHYKISYHDDVDYLSVLQFNLKTAKVFGSWQDQAEREVFVGIDPVDQVPADDTHKAHNGNGPNIAIQFLDRDIRDAALFGVLVIVSNPDYKADVSHNHRTH